MSTNKKVLFKTISSNSHASGPKFESEGFEGSVIILFNANVNVSVPWWNVPKRLNQKADAFFACIGSQAFRKAIEKLVVELRRLSYQQSRVLHLCLCPVSIEIQWTARERKVFYFSLNIIKLLFFLVLRKTPLAGSFFMFLTFKCNLLIR